MSLTMVSGASPEGFISSQADYVSFAIQDDGTGGSLWINGLGINGSPTVVGDTVTDLQTFFAANTTLFHAIPLLLAFRRLAGKPISGGSFGNVDAQAQFLSRLDTKITPLVSTPQSAAMPAIYYSVSRSTLAGQDVPYFGFLGPGAGGEGGGTWRVDMRLRHSLTD